MLEPDKANAVELEFTNFQTPSEDGYDHEVQKQHLAAFLSKNAPNALRPLTHGMFGYSVTRQGANKRYFYDIYDNAVQFRCDIEGWHTESGPGVFEAVSIGKSLQPVRQR
jgi:glutamine synthetase